MVYFSLCYLGSPIWYYPDTKFGDDHSFLYGSEAVRMPMIGELFPTHLRATATGVSGSLAVTTAWLLAPLLISWGSESIGWPLTLTYFGIIPLFVSSVVFLFLPNKHSNTQIY